MARGRSARAPPGARALMIPGGPRPAIRPRTPHRRGRAGGSTAVPVVSRAGVLGRRDRPWRRGATRLVIRLLCLEPHAQYAANIALIAFARMWQQRGADLRHHREWSSAACEVCMKSALGLFVAILPPRAPADDVDESPGAATARRCRPAPWLHLAPSSRRAGTIVHNCRLPLVLPSSLVPAAGLPLESAPPRESAGPFSSAGGGPTGFHIAPAEPRPCHERPGAVLLWAWDTPRARSSRLTASSPRSSSSTRCASSMALVVHLPSLDPHPPL